MGPQHEVASEAKESFLLWSKYGEVQARSLEHALSRKGHWQGCFIGFLLRGGVPAGQVQLRYSGRSRSKCQVQRCCTRYAVAVSTWGVMSSASASVRHSRFTLGALVSSARYKASAHSTLWASAARLSMHVHAHTHTHATQIRLYFIPQILFLFPGNCDWALLVTPGQRCPCFPLPCPQASFPTEPECFHLPFYIS